ncbi:MAG: hypothetical protein R3F43_27700 [bacterium]
MKYGWQAVCWSGKVFEVGVEIARFGASGFSLKADGQDGGALYTYRIEVEMLSAGTGVRLIAGPAQIAVENEVRWQAGAQVRTLPQRSGHQGLAPSALQSASASSTCILMRCAQPASLGSTSESSAIRSSHIHRSC